MKDRILKEPAFCLGLIVWVVAVSVFPLQLGLGRANLAAFAAYVAIAGGLLATADAVLNPTLYRRASDVLLQGMFWTVGIAVPALLAFAIGSAVAPTHQTLSDDLCALGGLEGANDPDDRTDTAVEDALETMDDCAAGE